MAHLETLKKRAQNEGFTFEAVKDSTGVKGISLSFGADHYFVLNNDWDEFDGFIHEIFSHKHEKICFDMRDVLKLGCNFKRYCDVIDVSVMAGEENLYKAVNKHIKDADVVEYLAGRHEYNSHIKACKTAKINLDEHSLIDIIPSKVVISFYRLRNWMVNTLVKKFDSEQFRSFGYDRARVLYLMEENSVHVDPDNIDLDAGMTTHDLAFIQHIRDKMSGSYVYNKFIPQRTKTGRVHTAKGSFKCMNIPRNHVRQSIVSRFDGGKIATFDFNAADYRCIVASVDDENLNAYYEGCDDFHDRTVEYIFGDNEFHDTSGIRRRVLKTITYTRLYGGSLKNLPKTTGLSSEKVGVLVEKLNELFAPIVFFREKMYSESMNQGYVITPDDMKIDLNGSEHPGKVLALYAQTCTSDVFMDSIVSLHDFLQDKKSVMLFTVHDELVIDMHPDEMEYLDEMRDIMELGSARLFGMRLKVKVKSGLNYWDQND